jgi:pumilio family protein 6
MKNVKRKAEQGSAGDSPTKKKKDEDGKKTKQDSTTSDAGGSSSQQKRALKQERQSLRRHADSVGEAKAIWNKLRLKVNSKEETKKMVTDLMNLIEGKMHEISLQHDASRVVQAALQFGNLEQRIQVVTELCKSGQFPELCRVQYSHFVVLKMIKYCARDDVNTRMIVKVRTLFVVREAVFRSIIMGY